MIHGMIAVNKEIGYTSHDVVAIMRGIFGQKKIGHTGTLDPDASGVLPICLGNATKLSGMLTDQDKEYIAELRLGVTTSTQDMSGTIQRRRPVDGLKESDFDKIVREFASQGEYWQIPPMYSAIKIGGKKLYELARSGKEIERPPRQVQIYEAEILNLNLSDAYAKIRVRCSKGTYIRTFITDIGERFGCGAAMAGLVRTRVGSITLSECVTIAYLEKEREAGTLTARLLPTDSFFEDLPALHIQNEMVHLLQNGNSFFVPATVENPIKAPERIRAYDESGRFYGIYQYDRANMRYRPEKMFL